MFMTRHFVFYVNKIIEVQELNLFHRDTRFIWGAGVAQSV
jgi:hypothetical protein